MHNMCVHLPEPLWVSRYLTSAHDAQLTHNQRLYCLAIERGEETDTIIALVEALMNILYSRDQLWCPPQTCNAFLS